MSDRITSLQDFQNNLNTYAENYSSLRSEVTDTIKAAKEMRNQGLEELIPSATILAEKLAGSPISGPIERGLRSGYNSLKNAVKERIFDKSKESSSGEPVDESTESFDSSNAPEAPVDSFDSSNGSPKDSSTEPLFDVDEQETEFGGDSNELMQATNAQSLDRSFTQSSNSLANTEQIPEQPGDIEMQTMASRENIPVDESSGSPEEEAIESEAVPEETASAVTDGSASVATGGTEAASIASGAGETTAEVAAGAIGADEAVGAALDSSVIGAPVGAVLGAAGALAAAGMGIYDLITGHHHAHMPTIPSDLFV